MGFCLIVVLSCAIFTACTNQESSENDNDKLGAERMSLQQQIDALQNKLALREGELHATREQLDDPLPPMEGVEPRRLSGIVLGVYSGPVDLDGDTKFDALRVYIRPIDQRSRQITAEGIARVRLIVMSDDGEPKAILDETYGPDAFAAAYHTSITGTHYALKADLPDERPTEATLHVTLIDAATGKVFVAKKEVALIRQPN